MSRAVEIGDKLHIMTRRLFEQDIRRHFIGEVTGVSEALVEVRGYTFIFHSGSSGFSRLPELRTRVFSLGDSGHVVNKIPRDVDVGAVSYGTEDSRLVITDGGSFSLPINEFGATR